MNKIKDVKHTSIRGVGMKLIIKQIRKEKGKTLEDLEEDIGISRKRLSELENNEVDIEKVLFIEMFLIANSLGTLIEDLFVNEIVELQ